MSVNYWQIVKMLKEMKSTTLFTILDCFFEGYPSAHQLDAGDAPPSVLVVYTY